MSVHQPERPLDKSLWTGVFLVSLPMLAFEIFSSRILAIVIGPAAIYTALASAMLGMSSAGSLVSVIKRRREESGEPFRPAFLSFLFGGLCLVSLAAVSFFLDRAISAKPLLMGAFLLAPYFIFGLLITLFFRSLREGDYHLAYFADLAGASAGASAGALTGAFVLDSGGYRAALALILASAFAGGGMFTRRLPARTAAFILTAAVLCLPFVPGIPVPEPKPDIPALARLNLKIMEGVTAAEEWRRWGSYSRIIRLRYDAVGEGAKPLFKRAYVIGRGEGMARFLPYDETVRPDERGDYFSVFRPEKFLVMFAGTGAEMIYMDKVCGGKCRITGVEVDRHMIGNALSFEEYRLKDFFSRPGISLRVEEGRSFLEKDPSRYDFILYAASGSQGMKHYTSSADTAQYLYTLEGLRAAVEHLEPGGVLAVQTAGKARLMTTLRTIMGGNPLSYTVVIIQPGFLMRDDTPWKHPWDEKTLYFKPSGFSADEWSAMKQLSARRGDRIVLGPGGYAAPGYEEYKAIALAPDLQALYQRMKRENRIDISPRSDDRPYVFNLSPGITARREQALIRTVFGFSLAGLVIIFLPLLIAEKLHVSKRKLGYALFFFLTGAGFMMIEIGLIERMNLLLGNPAYGAAFVLAAIVASAGIGSLCSERLFAGDRRRFRAALFLLLVSTACLFAVLHFGGQWILSLPFFVKIPGMAAAFFPAGFLMGQFFPQALKHLRQEAGVRYVPWAWAVQGAASVLAIGAALLTGRFAGNHCLLAGGMILYALAWFAPPAASSRAG